MTAGLYLERVRGRLSLMICKMAYRTLEKLTPPTDSIAWANERLVKWLAENEI